MDDPRVKFDELRTILRDLSWLLGQQQEIILSQTAVIGVIRKTLESDPALSKKYADNLQSLKGNETKTPDQAAMNTASALLQRMIRW